jgi:hypothetical protein
LLEPLAAAITGASGAGASMYLKHMNCSFARVGHVAFRTDLWRVGIENRRKGQVFRGASALRGKSRSLEDQEPVGCDAEAGGMMESPPASRLEVSR